MLIKDLIKNFSNDTCYSIVYADNPHYTVWYSRGNKTDTPVDLDNVKGIQHTAKKIIIYI